MKKIIPLSLINSFIGVAFCFILSSFSSSPGAHRYQVYLDHKLTIDQYVNLKADAPKLLLNASEKYNQLIVKYSECERTVTGRTLTLKDDKDKVLKTWHFDGETSGYSDSMTCPMKDIIALKQKASTLKLYYSSNDFPEGQQIVYLIINGETRAALNN